MIKTMKKRFLSLLLLIPLIANAYDFKVENEDGITIYYEKYNDKTVSIVRGDIMYEGNIVIPAEITVDNKTYLVTRIGDNAFLGCTELLSVIMPESIVYVGQHAFEYASNLEVLSFSNNITHIGDCGLKGCKKLKEAILPSKLTFISSSLLEDCESLEVLFIPKSVGIIGSYSGPAFSNCVNLKKVIIEDIEAWCKISADWNNNPLEYAHHLFLGDEEIKHLVIPNTVRTIRVEAFAGCTGFESITIPNSVTSIGHYAFASCGDLDFISIESGNINYNSSLNPFNGTHPKTLKVPNISALCQLANNGLFIESPHQLMINEGLITELVIPSDVVTIPEKTFYKCVGLKNVNFSYATTSIGKEAFYGCTGLDSKVVAD